MSITSPASCQLGEELRGVYQVGGVEAFGEPAVDRREQGRRGEARDLLAPVYGWFTEGFNTPDLKDAAKLLSELA